MAWDEDPAWREDPGWRQDPAKRQPGGKETGAVRKRFFGNTEIAQRFMGPGRTLLGQLKQDMAFNGLPQGLRRAVIPINQRVEIGPELSKEGNVDIARRFVQLLGTVAIVAYSSHGQSEVLIDARAINTTEVVVEPKVPKVGRYDPYLFIALEAPTNVQSIYITEPNPPSAQALGQGTTFNLSEDGGYQPQNGVNTSILVGEEDGAFIDYVITENGLCLIPDFPAAWPAALQEAMDKAQAREDLAVHFYWGAYFLDPGIDGLPFTPVVVPGWYYVEVMATGNSVARDFKVIVELGKNPQPFYFEFSLGIGENWDKAFLIDVENGVIAQIPRPSTFISATEVRLTPEPDSDAEYFYHTDSPLLSQNR